MKVNKRPWLLGGALTAIAALSLTACGSSIGGDTDTIAFTVDETNEVDPFDFYATYQDEDLLYEVSSSVRGDRFTLTATATTPELSLTLDVEATVSGDSMTGTYEFRATNAQGGTFTTGGTFAANRL